jgi:hypothetical protein
LHYYIVFRGEKKVNSAALRKAAKEARQAEIERAREVNLLMRLNSSKFYPIKYLGR